MPVHAIVAILVVGTGILLGCVEPPSDAADPASRPIVMGFVLDGDQDAELPWSALTDVVCFSLKAEADGRLENDCGWPWSGFIEKARARGTRVSLCVTGRDGRTMDELVSSEENRATFFAAVVEAMRQGGVPGLGIDFESFAATSWIEAMPGFMTALTAHVHAAIPGSFVFVCTPPDTEGHEWDYGPLGRSCDAIFMMGYNFNGGWSKHPGPSAPLTGDGLSLTEALQGPFATVVRDAPEKLILGMPLYGNEWIASSEQPGADAEEFLGTIAVRYIVRDEAAWTKHWDEASQTPYWTFQRDGRWHQVWGEDARSIGLKVELAMRNRLGGVGVWRLGFAGADNPVWPVIARSTAAD